MSNPFRSRPFVAWPFLAALIGLGLEALLAFALAGGRGLTRTEQPIPGATAGGTAVHWSGSLYVPAAALYEFSLQGEGRVVLYVGGVLAHECERPSLADTCPARALWLTSGFHLVNVASESRGPAPEIPVRWAEAGGPLHPLDTACVIAGRPRYPALRSVAERASVAARVFSRVAAGAAVWFWLAAAIPALVRRLRARVPAGAAAVLGRRVAIGLLGVALAYAAILRCEALTTTYGPVDRPGWLREAQLNVSRVAGHLRPSAITYQPAPLYPHKDSPPSHYFSDAYTYLGYARGMRSFYAAHYREPVFPALTKVWLVLLDDQDVAVSLASMSFSILALAAVYALGAAAFSRAVGLGAAAAMAIEERLIAEGIAGGRDEVFMFALAVFAWALVRWWRSPSLRRAAVVGFIGGGVLLVRFTAFTAVVPGLACVLLLTDRPWRARVREAGLAALVALLVTAPYLVNCWVTFGDPFYTLNYHANIYRVAEGQAADPSATSAGWVVDRLVRRPLETIDTAVWGLTAYPFLQKWSGFDVWSPSLGPGLSWAALLGLSLFLWSWPGRLLLVVLVGSLLPYAVTWRIGTDWRFTEHAYPFFLLASCAAIHRVGCWLTPTSLARFRSLRWIPAGRLAAAVTVLVTLTAGWWVVSDILPWFTARESLSVGEDISIGLSGRDAAMFGPGWSSPATSASVTYRVAIDQAAEVLVPLAENRDYGATVRLDPFPRPLGEVPPRLPVVEVLLNGVLLSRLELRWTPERVGAYDLRLPRSAVRPGANRLRFVTVAAREPGGGVPHAEPGVSEGSLIALWYVRVRSSQR